MARRGGLEPPTFWLRHQCSIRLSYRRVLPDLRARAVLVALDLLPTVKKGDERGKKKNSQRLFRALNRSGRFIRVSHGRYRVNDFYRDTVSLSEKNMRLLRFLRSRQAS